MDGERYRNCKHKRIKIAILILTEIDFKAKYMLLLKYKRGIS